MELPTEMTPAIAEVIGTPCFMCMEAVCALREIGYKVDRKAEAEQAAYIWFLLPFAIKYGAEWRHHALDELIKQTDAYRAAHQR